MDLEFQTQLRQATKRDLLVKSGLLRLDQIIYVVTPVTRKVCGPFVIDRFISSKKMEELYNQNLIYVPKVTNDESLHDLLQTEFKNEALKSA